MNAKETIRWLVLFMVLVCCVAGLVFTVTRKSPEEEQLLEIRDQIVRATGYEPPSDLNYGFGRRTNHRFCDEVFALGSTFAPQYMIEGFTPRGVLESPLTEFAEQYARSLESDASVQQVARYEKPSLLDPTQASLRIVDWTTDELAGSVSFGATTSVQIGITLYRGCEEGYEVANNRVALGFEEVAAFNADNSLSTDPT